MKKYAFAIALALITVLTPDRLTAQSPDRPFLPISYEEKTGKLTMQISRLNEDFLYLTSLATGLGSNALGLDRGSTGAEAVVQFQKFGNRLFLVRRNLDYRATRGDSVLARSVEESFATSVIASFPVQSENAGVFSIDITDFVVQDVMNVRGTISGRQQGNFSLDKDRSAVFPARTKAFPQNTEVDVIVTLRGDNPGREIVRHSPDARAITLHEHHSFVQLPDGGYTPRALDPRIGVFATSFMDFSLPLDQDPQIRWINRWRLQKKNPGAAISDPVKPIVYYLDRGVPEPYRTAFKQGGAWWAKAFEAAGFSNAFRIEDLPADADPMDARYSVIQWVHRSDPGFSIGQSVSDPRTGEIIKAAVKMDTYRSLTDYNIFAGMMDATDGTEFTMSRRRQHVAHEIGHTLGLAHNYISHAFGRESVMDYPGPLITLRKDGTIDVSNAYRSGIGAYDSLAIRFAYAQFNSPEQEKRGLDAIAHEAIDKGIRFLSDGDAGAGVIPEVTRWLNGTNAVEELKRQSAVRDVLLNKFDEKAIDVGDPMWSLNRRLVPVYLHHRYAIEAATKTIGGMNYTFALRGDNQKPTEAIPSARQREALRVLAQTIAPRALAIPDRLTSLIPPSPFGYDQDDWSFGSSAGIVFDPLAIARALAGSVTDGILNPERMQRVNLQHAGNAQSPSVTEVMNTLVTSVYAANPDNAQYAALRRISRRAVVESLLTLAADPRSTADVRAAADYTLAKLATRLASSTVQDADEAASNAANVRDIRNWLDKRIALPRNNSVIQLPPGTPIGN